MKVKVERAPVYVRLFDKKAVGWSKDPVTNRFFLEVQQQYATELLKSRGRNGLYLNEVLDMLGIRRVKAGQVVGWIYDENDPTCDNYVDFGFGDWDHRGGVNGAIVLSFNIDGDILSRI
jgi:hypothetical protein